MNLIEGKTYQIYTKVESAFWKGALKDLITKIINKIKAGHIIDVQVGAEKKKAKVIKVERYISTHISGKVTEGIVWTIKVLQNPIPLPVLILAINSLVYVIIGIIVVLSLDKIDEVVKSGSQVIESGSKAIRETGTLVQKSTPALLIAGATLLGYVYLKSRK